MAPDAVRPPAGLNLRTRLRLALLVVLLPGLAYILTASLLEHQQARAQAQTELVKLVRLAAGEAQQSVANVQVKLALVAALDGVQPSVNGSEPGACGAPLNAVAQALPTTGGFAVWTLGGDLVCSNPVSTQPASASHERWFQRAIASQAFSIGDFRSTAQNDQSTITFGYPAFDSRHQLMGVVSADLDLNQLIPMNSEMAWPPDTVVTIFDPHGLVLARSADASTWVGNSLPDLPGLAAALADSPNSMERADVDGAVRLTAFAPITGPGGSLVYLSIGRASVAVYGSVDTALAVGLALTVVLTLLAVLLAAWWSRQTLERPLQELVWVANRLAGGDRTARAQPAAAGSEVDQLAGAVNRIAASLADSERQRQQGEARQIELEEQLRRSQARATQLETVAASMSKAATPAEVIEVILRQGGSALGAASATLLLLTDGEQWLRRAAHAGPPDPVDRLFQQFPVSSPLPAADVVRTGQAMWIESAAAYRARYPQLIEVINSTDYEAAVALPLRIAGRLIGVLMLSFPGELRASADASAYLAGLGSLCALGLDRAGLKNLML